jgi:hypothetical protein
MWSTKHSWCEKLALPTFRRKMEDLGVLEAPAGKTKLAGSHRPAQLYRVAKPFTETAMTTTPLNRQAEWGFQAFDSVCSACRLERARMFKASTDKENSMAVYT